MTINVRVPQGMVYREVLGMRVFEHVLKFEVLNIDKQQFHD